MTQHEIEAMSATFELKDVIYIVVGVGSALGFYWKMVMTNKENKTAIDQQVKDLDRVESTTLKKFSSVHSRMEKNEQSNKEEVALIRKDLTELKVGIVSINSKLDVLIDKK